MNSISLNCNSPLSYIDYFHEIHIVVPHDMRLVEFQDAELWIRGQNENSYAVFQLRRNSTPKPCIAQKHHNSNKVRLKEQKGVLTCQKEIKPLNTCSRVLRGHFTSILVKKCKIYPKNKNKKNYLLFWIPRTPVCSQEQNGLCIVSCLSLNIDLPGNFP